MPKLVALSPVNHDGKDYAEGDEFEVKDKDQAQALKDAGAAVIKGEKAEKPAE